MGCMTMLSRGSHHNIILYDSHTPGFKWFIQNYEFITDLRILKLCKYDIMLGVDWLRVYSPILFYFIKMKISFKNEGKMIGLKRIVDEAVFRSW